jgi:hypothetical protein
MRAFVAVFRLAFAGRRSPMRRKIPLAEGETARTACVRVLVRSGVDEKTGELLPPAVVAQRVRWCADLVAGMAAAVLAERWNAPDVARLASGVDAGEQPLPSSAWMALRRLGWTARPAEDVTINDRVVRMAQEQAGRTLRSTQWRADVVAGILRTWPARSAAAHPGGVGCGPRRDRRRPGPARECDQGPDPADRAVPQGRGPPAP